jgi:hypothetical protein
MNLISKVIISSSSDTSVPVSFTIFSFTFSCSSHCTNVISGFVFSGKVHEKAFTLTFIHKSSKVFSLMIGFSFNVFRAISSSDSSCHSDAEAQPAD